MLLNHYSSCRWTSLLFALSLFVVLSSCTSTKKAQQKASPYARAPQVETTDERLKFESMIIDATMKAEVGKRDEAMALLRQVLALDSNCAAANYEMSRLLSASGSTINALVHARKAFDADRSNVWYGMNLANIYRYANMNEWSAKTWQAIVNAHPDVIEYYMELTSAYNRAHDTKNAIATLNRVEKKIGVTEAVSVEKARIWSLAGNESKAMAEMEALVKTMPNDSRYNSILAESYMSTGQYEKAKQCYDRVLATNPDDEYVHISLAEYYKAVGQPRKAYEELRVGMQQKNLSTTNKLKVLTNFYTSDEFYGIHSRYAFDLLDVAMKAADDSTSYAAFYGDALMRQRKYVEAAHQFALALSADSSKYEIWEALLISELSYGADNSILASHGSRASALFPLHQLPYYVQAVALYEQKRYGDAVEMAQKCEKLGFEKDYLKVETYELMAMCYNQLDNPLCYEYYEKLLAINPDDVNTMNSYAYRLAVDNKELERAEKMSKRTLQKEPDNAYYLDTYGWILYKMGRNKEAAQYIKRAMSRSETSEEVKEHWEAVKQYE